MIKKIPLAILLCLLLHIYCNGQKKRKPNKASFNIGIFSGLGGVNFSPIPGLDLQYKGNILRFAPGKNIMAGGYIREIGRLAKTYKNWYWIGSVYFAQGKEKALYPNSVGNPYIEVITRNYRGILLTGLKAYLGNRVYSQMQAGCIYTQYHTERFADKRTFGPYFEFSIGINIWKNFRKPFKK